MKPLARYSSLIFTLAIAACASAPSARPTPPVPAATVAAIPGYLTPRLAVRMSAATFQAGAGHALLYELADGATMYSSSFDVTYLDLRNGHCTHGADVVKCRFPISIPPSFTQLTNEKVTLFNGASRPIARGRSRESVTIYSGHELPEIRLRDVQP